MKLKKSIRVILTLLFACLLNNVPAFADNNTSQPWHDHTISGCVGHSVETCGLPSFSAGYYAYISGTMRCPSCGAVTGFAYTGYMGIGNQYTFDSIAVGSTTYTSEHCGFCGVAGYLPCTVYSKGIHYHSASCYSYTWSCGKTENKDTLPPALTASRSMSSDQRTGYAHINMTDALSGCNSIQNPLNGAWSAGSTLDFSVAGAGSWTVYGKDNAGNIGSVVVSFATTDFDSTPPSISAYSTNTSWTNGNVGINYSASDGGSGLAWVSCNGAGITANGTYTATVNGTYTFTACDNVGLQSSTTVTVNNIDKSAPTIQANLSTTQFTNSNVTANVVASDTGGSNVSKIQYSYDNYNFADWCYSASNNWLFGNNGTVYFRAVDTAGNYSPSKQVSVVNIDKDTPVATVVVSTTNWAAAVLVRVDSSDSTSGVKSVTVNGSPIAVGSGNYNAVANGNYVITVLDNANNSSQKTVVIDNVDTVKPTITITYDKLSNGTVDIKITDNVSGVKSMNAN